jgi:ribosomal protein L10
MGRTLENKQQIVEELKGLLGEAEMALVLDFKGLSIKEMTDLRTRLQASNGVCKVTKNTLMATVPGRISIPCSPVPTPSSLLRAMSVVR